MQHRNYECPKCQNRSFDTDQIATTGAGWSKIFDLQNRKFHIISCARCGYSEMYKGGRSRGITQILDFFTT